MAPAQPRTRAGRGGRGCLRRSHGPPGHARRVADSAGQVVWAAEYSAFGEAFVDVASSIEFNIRFPGQYFDAETGLHYNRFRYYDPGVGRYISADPIGQRGDFNIYRYAGNTPSRVADPLGLQNPFESSVDATIESGGANARALLEAAGYAAAGTAVVGTGTAIMGRDNAEDDEDVEGFEKSLNPDPQTTEEHKARNREQTSSTDPQDFADKESEILNDYPDQTGGKVKQRLKDLLKNLAKAAEEICEDLLNGDDDE